MSSIGPVVSEKMFHASILSLPSQNDGNLGSFALISQDANFVSVILSAFILA